jgi:pyochelin synthetase
MTEVTGVATLIADLEMAGVQLWEEESRLHYRAPAGVMTEDRLARLRECKLEVLAELRRSADAVQIAAQPGARFDPFPLTDVQYAYLTGRGSTLPDGGVGCHGYGELRFDDLDAPRLEAAWQALIRRHDMLRMVAHKDGSQEVMAQAQPYRINVTDLRGQPEINIQDMLQSTRAQMDHRVYQAGEWPLFDLRVTQTHDFSILHFSLDFLIADFVSIDILLEELDQLYMDPASSLPALSITFRDFLLADRARRAGRQAERDRAYWWSRLAELPEAPDLPIRVNRKSIPRFRRWQASLAAADWWRLCERARQESLTPSAAVLAAFAEVVGRWSRKQRFTLNLTMLNRPQLHPEVWQLVGDFTSVELLAVDLSTPSAFRDRARALQQQLWADMDHSLYSGIDVMRELRQQQGSGLAVLFPVVFTSSVGAQRAPDPQVAGRGLSRLVGGISQTPQVWLDCQVAERDGGLAVNWDVREGIFSDGLIDAMFGAFDDLIRRLAAGAAWELSCPVPLPEAQRHRRAAANDTRAPVTDTLLHEPFMDRAAREPDRIAVVATGRTLTYGQLAGHAAAVARAIADEGGHPGDIIAIEMDKGWEQVTGVLGTLLAGCAYLPVDTNQPRARRDRILDDAGARVVLTQSWLPAGGRADVTAIPVDALETPAPDVCSRLAGPGDLAYVIYTSGSTGKPKGVKISHRSAWNTVSDINRRFGVDERDSVLALASLGFDLSVYDIFGLLSAGGSVVIPDAARRRDPSHWAELITTQGITLWNSVPAQFEMLLSFLKSSPGAQVSALRVALLSGDWIPVTLPGQALEHIPELTLISLGGATEASIWSIMYPVRSLTDDLANVPYGKPLANQTFHVLGESLQPLPDLVPGELYIGGLGVAMGYLGDEAKTAERFIRHPQTGERLYRTGDLGYYLQDGNIAFLGREDSQFKVRGYRVELAEIEAAMLAHDAVAAVSAVAIREPPGPSRIAAFAEPAARRAAPAPMTAPRLAELAATAASELRSGADNAQMIAFARQLDQTALIQMLCTLRANGLFAHDGQAHSLDQVLTQLRVSDMHRRLARRWLAALCANGLLHYDQDSGRYCDAAPADDSAVEEAWRRVDALRPDAEQRSELLSYFRLAGRHLGELLRGELDPVTLLFPEGRTEIHEAAYNGMFLSRYLNKLLAAAAAEIVSRWPGAGPCKVLEVGAGVGGTSVELIPALAGLNADYLFTDVSQFFLNNARKQFRDWQWVDYAIFDMNLDYRRQGHFPNSYGLIVCANVLHYARNAADTVGRLRELLAPGGWLLFIEATRDNYQILTSMEFLFDDGSGDFTDARAATDKTFLTLEQWLEILAAAEADSFVDLPRQDPIVEQMGIRMFAARFKSGADLVMPADLRAHLSSLLPDYMVPAEIQVVDRLPLTANGKVDRVMLRSWLPSQPGSAAGSAADGPASDLERAISDIWRRLLRAENVGRNEDFFSLGGDSLLAAQLVTDLRAELPEAAGQSFDELLELVLGGPTVASLAGRLAGATPVTRPDSPGRQGPTLVRLKEGPGLTDVFVHDATGTLAAYQTLIGTLASDRQVFGLAVPDSRVYLDTSPQFLIELAAGDYARELRSATDSPIRLIGQHFGGIMALEVARQLAESGTAVQDLVVIASPPVPWLPDNDLLTDYLYCRETGDDPLRLGYPAEEVVARGLAGPPDELTGLLRQAGAGRPDGLRTVADDPGEGYQVFRQSMRACAAHEPLPYAGDVTLLCPASSCLWPAIQADMTAFWRKLCLGDLKIQPVSGDYFSWQRHGSAEVAEFLDRSGASVSRARR